MKKSEKRFEDTGNRQKWTFFALRQRDLPRCSVGARPAKPTGNCTVRAEKHLVGLSLHPPAMLKDNLGGVHRIGIRIQATGVGPINDGFVVATKTFVFQRISRAGHEPMIEGRRPRKEIGRRFQGVVRRPRVWHG